MAQPEILKPLQKDQKTGPFLIRKATEFRQILPPAPADFEGRRRAHGLEKSGFLRQGQTKSVLLTIFFQSVPFKAKPGHPPRESEPVISAGSVYFKNLLALYPDINTLTSENPCQIKESRQF
jgi:hypothetical protein